jgi:sulfide:quinone oxidoreductase
VSHDSPKVPSGLRVLIAGGGVAGLEVLLALHALAEDRVDVELLAPETHLWYRPLAVAEPFGLGRVQHFELAGIAAGCRARFTLGGLASVEPEPRIARTTTGLELAYDILVLACGARPEPALEGAFTFRGPADTDAFSRLLADVEAGSGRRVVFALPSATAWPLPAYELALMTAARFADRPGRAVEVALVTAERRPLGLFGTAASEAIERLLAERGVTLWTARHAVEAAGGVLRLARTASFPSIASSLSHASAASRSPASLRTGTDSSRPTQVGAFAVSTACTRPATSPRFP